MLLLLQILLVLIFVGSAAMMRASMQIWAPAIVALLLVLSIFTTPPWWFLIVSWLVFLGSIACLGIPSIRYKWVTKPMMLRLRKVLPPMSDTERVALEAGGVWWEAELFHGRPDWQKLCKMPLQGLNDEEQAFIDNQVETVCSMLNDFRIVYEHRDLPTKVWDYLKKERFFGMVIPKEYGGLGFSALAHSTVVVKIASRSISAAVNTMVPNSLGPGELLSHYGTEEQKQYYLPRLARGEEIPCFALTGPEAGSDATAIPDTGIICKGQLNGQEIIGIRLNFDKRYITLAPVATVIGVAFKLYDPDHLLGNKEEIGITLCLIPAKHPGVEVGARHLPLGLAFMNGPVRGKDVFIPLDWIIGGVAMAGHGWRMLMECLSIGRSISLPALSTAIGILCYRTTGAYARIRRQFRLPLGRFEGVEEALSRIAGFTYMLEATRHLTAAGVDAKAKPSLASAIAKYHMTELSRKVMEHAMDIHAGRGIQLGPRNYLGLGYHAVPLSITVEGANILTRNLIIFGQGAMRCHPFVRGEMAAVADSDATKGFAAFDKLLFKHIGFAVSNFIGALAMGLGATRFISVPRGRATTYYRQLTRMSTALALAADMAMLLLGGTLKRKERLSARLGDVLSHLYMASSVLKYYEDHKQPEDDLPHVQWVVQMCLYNSQSAFEEFCTNFPNRWVGRLLRFVIFPLGRAYKIPTDRLGHKLAQKMLVSSAFRDRLTQYCYVGKDPQDPVGRMEQALIKVVAAEPLEKKLQEAIKNGAIADPEGLQLVEAGLEAGILTKQEAELIRVAERLRMDAIAVDDFEKF